LEWEFDMPSIRDSIILRLESLDKLPMISDTVQKVQDQLSRGVRGDDTAASMATIGAIVERDIGLSAKVLKIANSVFYAGRYGPIGDVKQAVARLGIEEVARICTTVSTMQMFADKPGIIDMKEFWKHCLGVALVMRHFAERSVETASYQHNAYVAGLFHDVGILILDQYFSPVYKAVRETGKNNPLSLYNLEREVLGIDHGEIGATLLRRWRLPDEICEAVKWHHLPDGAAPEYKKLAQLVNVANFACSALGIQEPGDDATQTSIDGTWHDLKLDTSDLNRIADDVEEGIARSGVFVSMAL